MASTDTAVTVIEQSAVDAVVEWNLDEFPVERFNRLIPTQTLSIPTDLLRPVVQIVALNPDPNAGDVYHSNDMPDGHAAPTKVALRKFATAAGISFVDERRTDDGSDPDVIEVTCVAEMLLPTGQRLRAVGQKRIDLGAQTWKSTQHRAKFKSFFLEQVASRAENRAIRALLSLRGSYPIEVYRKPFAVVSYAPNMAHPEVRSRILDALAPTAAQLYGPTNGQKALPPGAPIDVTPAADEDPAPSMPTVLPGEKLAAAGKADDAQPDWLSGAAAADEPAEKPKVDLADLLRSSAEASSMKGKATEPQLKKLRAAVFDGIEGTVVGAGIVQVFGDEALKQLTGAQAQAFLNAHESLEHGEFVALWTAMVQDASAAA